MNAKLLVVWAAAGLLFAGCKTRDADTSRSEVPVSDQPRLSPTSDPNPVALPIHSISERGPHHKTWQRIETVTNALGQPISTTNRAFVELATGLHFWQDGQWKESREEIIALPGGGAAATNGQHQAYFPSDIHEGVIELVSSDGIHLYSRPLGISYFDGSNSVMIAELTNSIGQLLPSGNQILYSNAFTDFEADLICTYRLSGFECDLVFREIPPGPETFGLNPQNTRLQFMTEFFNTPEPVQTVSTNSRDGMVDATLQFGTMKMVRGRAFLVGDTSELAQSGNSRGIPVYKTWSHLENRTFLFEEVPYPRIEPEFQTLIGATPGASRVIAQDLSRRRALPTLILPRSRAAQPSTNAVNLSRVALDRRPGFVLDYVTINSGSSPSNYVFQADTTYYITGQVNLAGTTIFEGGTVLKYASNVSASLYPNAVSWKTEQYRPAVFTAKDDNSVGDAIAGSTGTPSGYYAAVGIDMAADGTSTLIENVRISYADKAVAYGYTTLGSDDTVRNIQILHCRDGLWVDDTGDERLLFVKNALFRDVGTAFSPYSSGTIEHLTIEGCTNLFRYTGLGEGAGFFFTNSILVNITNLTSPLGDAAVGGSHNLFCNSPGFGSAGYTNAAWPFQTVGGGGYYLGAESPYRNIGTTNIDATLLSELRKKTTYPPLVLSVLVLSNRNLTLSPQVQRDIDTPDLGFHYDPLDYAASALWFAGSTVTVTPGTAIAAFGTNVYTYGVGVGPDSQLVSEGTPSAVNRFVDYHTVHESPGSTWLRPSYALAAHVWGSSARLTCRFTDWSVLAQDTHHVRGESGSQTNLFQDCQFHGGKILFQYSNPQFVNSLMERVGFYNESYDSYVPTFRNNLFLGGIFDAYFDAAGPLIRDNLFDQTVIPDYFPETSVAYDGGHNGYVTNYDRLQPTKTTDVVLSNSPPYQIGPLGSFYYPTNLPLINSGSTNANLLGLYHHTTATNQVKESNSMVDAGFHYIALNTQLSVISPIDTDGDNIPDYLEDSDADGVADSGERDWQASENGTTGVPGLQVFTILKE